MLVRQNLEGFSWFLPFTNHSWRQKYMETMKILANHCRKSTHSILGRRRKASLVEPYDPIASNLSSWAPKPRGRWRWCCLKWWDVSIHRFQQVDALSVRKFWVAPPKTRMAFLNWQQFKGQRNWSTWHKSKKDGPLWESQWPSTKKVVRIPWVFFWHNEKETKIHKGFFSQYTNKANRI